MKTNVYDWIQLAILLFTMALMLSKHYAFFEGIFAIFYETHFSIVCVIVGSFSIIHGFYMMFRSFQRSDA